jgi:hypothetical protein
VARFLEEDHGLVEVSLADPMKRFLREIFAFTDEQLWGPSEKRNAPDLRYPRHGRCVNSEGGSFGRCRHCGRQFSHGSTHDCSMFPALSPRLALQQLGTEWGRAMYEGVWINYALRAAGQLLIGEKYRRVSYLPELGLHDRGEGQGLESVYGVVIADVRFPNELRRIREVGGKIWLIERPGDFNDEVLRHASEDGLDGEKFDSIVSNDGTLEHLREIVRITMNRHGEKVR